jgi:hypothetical protein
MIKYNIRSRQLVDIVSDIRRRRLIVSPYFQRKLVWRTVHKIDFIKTILMGLPFPEIFIANGDLDIDNMISTSCIVDGQQRLNSIVEFINDEYAVDNKLYSQLTPLEKEEFLKYEIAVIELDLKHDDPLIQEMFKRLNRTYYSLSNIEKLATEYAPSEFMLVSKLLSKELDIESNEEENHLEFDPNITDEFSDWIKKVNVNNFNKLIIESPIFTAYEISRKVHLNFTLNILGTVTVGFFNRNISKDILDSYSEDFPEKNFIISNLENVASKINRLKLRKNSYWYNKANIFSLIIAFYNNLDKIMGIHEAIMKSMLENFENNIPDEYHLAAKEGVNNKRERLIRNCYIEQLINQL